MAVPGFQEMVLPYLLCLADGKPRHNSEIRVFIEQALNVSQEDIEEMIPSGQTSKIINRAGWARTHLSKAGLTEQVERGVYQITDEGRKILASPPPKLDLKFLNTIPRHKAWFQAPQSKKPGKLEPELLDVDPPNERIEEAFDELNASLADSLLEAMATMDPYRFERLVIDLLFAMGYGGSREEAAMVTRKSNDEGVDGVINEDRLGLDVIYVQAKRWKNPVGRPDIQSFVGALAGKQAHKGVFITTSHFGPSAREYAAMVPQKVILIDGPRLASLMIEHDIGVSTTRTISLKRIDTDYFEEN
jgi:restriction system protein